MTQRYFNEVDIKKMKVHFVARKDYYMAIGWDLLRYHLFIDEVALKFSEPAFRGCLAHELAHIAGLNSYSFFLRIRKMFFTHANGTEERETDYVVAEKGLGRDLLQFHTEHNKTYKSYKRSEGLTKREIKQLIKKSIKK